MEHRIWILNQPTERGCTGEFEPAGTEVIILASQGKEVMVQKAKKAKFQFVCPFSNLTLKQ